MNLGFLLKQNKTVYLKIQVETIDQALPQSWEYIIGLSNRR